MMKKRNNATEKFTLDAGKNFLLYTFITMKRVNEVYLQLKWTEVFENRISGDRFIS